MAQVANPKIEIKNFINLCKNYGSSKMRREKTTTNEMTKNGNYKYCKLYKQPQRVQQA